MWQDMVSELILARGSSPGVKTRMGVEFSAKAVT